MNSLNYNNSVIPTILQKLTDCDDYHKRCDCLLEHDEITYLLEYIDALERNLHQERKNILEIKYVVNKTINACLKSD